MVRAVGGAKIHSNWSASAGQLVFTRDNASVGITWGEDGSGIDTTWFGETANAKMQWIVSADELYIIDAEARIASASVISAVLTTASIDSGHISSASITTGLFTTASITTAAISSASIRCLNLASASITGAVTWASGAGDITWGDLDVVLSTATGTKLGTGSTQKLGFFGATPVVQLAKASYNNFAGASDFLEALVDIGLINAT